jgi:hypothetical protein
MDEYLCANVCLLGLGVPDVRFRQQRKHALHHVCCHIPEFLAPTAWFSSKGQLGGDIVGRLAALKDSIAEALPGFTL